MKSIRFPIFLLVLVATLLLVSGCSKHYVDVYINEQCLFSTLDNGEIETLMVFPGDYVIFNNAREKPTPTTQRWVDLTFPAGLFELTTVRIEPGHRVILKVIADGPMSGVLGISGPSCPSGSPEFKVGEGP